MEHYNPEDFDEKGIDYSPRRIEDEAAANLLLSDQLMEEDEEDIEIYEMGDEEDDDYYEEDDEIIIPPTSEPKYSDVMDEDSFCVDDEESFDVGLVQENPFEPVYPAVSAGLLFDENFRTENDQKFTSEKGMVLEAISLDNILPAGSRRRHRHN